MLKILDEAFWSEVPTTKSQRIARKEAGLYEELTVDRLKLQAFRVDLFPSPIVEMIFAYCDSDGNPTSSTYQFSLSGNDALQFIDQSEFDRFADHLEDIAEQTSAPENAELQGKKRACGMKVEKISAEKKTVSL